MTEISFHFNVADKLLYTCRLLRKAHATGAQVAVTAEPETLSGLDQLLWSFSPTEFVPHSRGAAEGGVLAGLSVLLVDSPEACPHQGVLVNLGATVPAGFERFEKFVEIVTRSDSERAAARSRWKHYADRGYSLQRHDLAASGARA
ncbi:MAG: DNA polymerase III subunit chi [Polaromonas sp. 39-63-203]|jgi:DNA polymerase-3 subunit chi|uniref:DNA polymerase III subunit chi n=1 Tax=Polaromonas sp. TaxID=1869339 RepID=UPI000BCC2306|nr:DNA polymerase III subunit chi [Polaromonas sp.]OYY52672.1 MAG: DNA polymerase III subunit chi [Polaromonas sp. 35-63-240]OYY98521.1 MAG: DNA polymerase III subunit chi [Polaromonas sp. 28-63-22]OYZ83892.1 MAG: DNA polymerase III subunit chi [Polaromonas sp. 24-62-144]OZA98528.1 MAG: DNA polymerase III subunit chi [Polaromonas sp. 39-63-203]HQS32750.1 DNA polymerase III subunit chi [Polaromonas sp.]